MKRLIGIAAVALAALVVLVVATGAGGDSDGYKVRAIFDNAGFLVPGEDVKVSGVVVGTIASLDVTPERKAAVVLEITDPAFRDFKQDARCAVRLQSLLGEKYVACQPTQPRNEGERPSPSLRQIREGPGKGEYLLPIDRTSSPVDLDMLNNVMQLPERQRFAVIINELGTGLAGNGEELRAAIRRANPALDEFDRLLKTLGEENEVLARLAEDSDVDLTVLARERESISNFIDKAAVTATATAQQGDALERNFELLPQFLDEFTPTMERLEEFSNAATPVFEDLGAAAPSINQLFAQLGPFSEAALPTFRTLGDAAEISRRALLAARPVIQDIDQLARAAGPLGRDFAGGLRSLRGQYGIENFMRTVLGFAGSMNGYDSVSHYARVYALLTQCLRYEVAPTGCSATWNVRQSFDEVDADPNATSAATQEQAVTAQTEPSADALRLPTVTLPAAQREEPADSEPATAQTDPADTGGAADPPADAAADPRTGVLGYLLGSEAVR
ncbi:MlaD family protein [Conexibacter stalactiti]|uniref:MlaD family protein n=1 Tax=Conexibacter stalactiti TaxID=1940611 RepID=A0ABU4HM46_9ACTN|nr:MlaD family protein [Conexibacter stalactiti]MDW5594362.1 MlaD family protein [Conexibacter stalactiti]MEC5035004.1 MlaD family protein [Conexibacter stalactiti]